MEFAVLGPLEVTRGDESLVIASAKQRALLALLILNANRTLSPDRIIDELWPDEAPSSGTKAIVFHVSKLREALEPDRAKGESGTVLVTEPTGYVLRLDPDSVDAMRFEALAAEGRALLASDPRSAGSVLRSALALWRGEALADFVYEPFAQEDIRRLEELRLHTLEDRLEADLAVGNHDTVVGELEVFVAQHPLRERVRGQLMLALYRCGRQAASLRVYQEGRRLLAEELGIDPSPELRRLEDLVLRQDPELSTTPTAPSPVTRRNPYKGLRPFGEADTADFFGREDLVERLVGRLSEISETSRFLTLVGPSGSGKSSVVRAGVIPALRAGALPGSDRWLITTMYPGSRPWEELEAALLRVGTHPSARLLDELQEDRHGLSRTVMRVLPSDDSRLLLVVDQFEELFSLVKEEDTRARFVEALLAATAADHSRLLVVATLRADFLDLPLRHPSVGEHIRTGLEVITPLTTSELELAITRPARVVGATLEDGLAAEILADVAEQPGTLPLLQYAMTELFERSGGKPLGRSTYAEIGGVLDAVGRRAEDVYGGLAPESQQAARQIFLRLVTPGEGYEAVAGRVSLDELEALLGLESSLPDVLDEYGRRRLLTFDRDRFGEPTVEIAHEALLSRWGRLAAWIDEQREDLWIRGRLHDAAVEWVTADRNPGFLLSAGRLDLFETWAASTDLRFGGADREFLQASVVERRRREKEDRARIAHEKHLERRAANRLRALVGVFATAALVAAVLSLVVFGQRRAAREQEAIATARELAAASIGGLGSDPELSLLLALEAAHATTDRDYVVEEAMDALHWALQESQIPYPETDAPAVVRAGLNQKRGVFLLPPGQLIQHASEGVARRLSPDECRTYLHRATCPSPREPNEAPLDVYGQGAVTKVEQFAVGSLAGSEVRVLADVSGDARQLLASFPGDPGIRVEWINGPEGGDLETQLLEGEPFDVAILSRPALVTSLGERGHLIDMNVFLDPLIIGSGVDRYLAELATNDARVDGLPWAVSLSSLIWFPASDFLDAGYQIPGTWADLVALSEQMVGDDRTPWCLGVEAGTESGAIAVDWIEDLVLREAGPQVYDQWVAGGTPFTSGTVRRAFQRFGDIAFGEHYVLGSSTSIPSDLASWPMFSQDPKCWLHRAGAVSRAQWPERVSVELAAFPFPAVEAEFSNTMTGRVHMVSVLRDRPEVRRFVEYLLSPDAAEALADSSAFAGLLPARAIAQTLYREDLSRSQDVMLRQALAAEAFRIDASDLMPPEVGSGSFPEGLMTYLTWGETSLDQVVIAIGEAWP